MVTTPARPRYFSEEIAMYPTMEAVEAADHLSLCRWQRFLPSPAQNRIGHDDFDEVLKREAKIMDRIVERVKELGGFTPAISKSLGW